MALGIELKEDFCRKAKKWIVGRAESNVVPKRKVCYLGEEKKNITNEPVIPNLIMSMNY